MRYVVRCDTVDLAMPDEYLVPCQSLKLGL